VLRFHLAEDESVAAHGHHTFNHVAAPLQGLGTFARRHGRLGDEVARTSTDFCLDEAGMRAQVAVHAGIHDPKFDPLQSCKHADRRSAVQEIGHHLRGHFARIRADAAFRDNRGPQRTRYPPGERS